MKNVIRMDLRISLLITFIWSIMGPYTGNLKGLLPVEVLSGFTIAGSVSMELLMFLNKNTTFKSSTLYVIVYDIIYLVSVIVGYLFLDDKWFIITVMTMTIPYWPLVRNAGNKYKALVGERYPRYFVEHMSTRISVIETRVGMLALAMSGIISVVTAEPKTIVLVFIFASIIQSIWSIYSYKKYYVIFEK